LRALVTGAAGFIGAHVARALVEAGREVRALHLPTDRLDALEGVDAERVVGDVTDRDSVRAAMRGCDLVFHLAAIYALGAAASPRIAAVNVGGTRIVVEEAARAGVRRVVYTSSIARFGGQGRGRRATEESPFALGSTGDAYARSKALAHEVALETARAHDVDLVIVAPTGPIGPGDVRPTPTGRLLQSLVKLPVVTVTPTVVNFLDVREIARGHLLAAERGRRGESYLLGGDDHSLAELARRALAVLGRRRPVVEVPFAAARAAAHAAVAVARRTRSEPLFTPAAIAIAERGLAADCTKARRELGLASPPIERAIADAFGWWRARAATASRAAG
jgi:dihydroflavonol-4-reductase